MSIESDNRQDPRIVHGLDAIGDEARGGVLTIGNFDGVHLGHQELLRTSRALAEAEDCAVVAMTFDPLPDEIFHPEHAHQRITPLEMECRLLRECGADWVVVARTDAGLLGMSPMEFIDDVIVGRLAPRHLVEGRDFAFGKKRGGTMDTLREASLERDFVLHVVEEVMLDLPEGPDRISSTLIRMLVCSGRIAEANRCLGRESALYGEVIPGAGHGRVLEFPTANIAPDQVLPADGVYAGVASFNGDGHPAAVSVGNKPTLGPAEQTYVEAFLLDADEEDYYSRRMTLRLLERLREQRKFESAEALTAQIAKDVERVREICE